MSIRRVFTSFALLAIGIVPAAAETVFVGVVKIASVTSQCQNFRTGVATSRFHPFFTGQTDSSEGFSLVWQFGGDSYILRSRALDGTFRSAESGGLGWGGIFTFPSNQWAQIALTSARPTINATTTSVTLKGQIKRPAGDPGGLACVATFVGTYLKQQ